MRRHSLAVALGLVCLGPVTVLAAEIGSTVTPLADKTVTTGATLVAARNAFRVALNCVNTSTTIAVRWGDATVTASAGQRLVAGAGIEITNKAAIYMIAESSTAVVACNEETK